jgi:hypothetical protein
MRIAGVVLRLEQYLFPVGRSSTHSFHRDDKFVGSKCDLPLDQPNHKWHALL